MITRASARKGFSLLELIVVLVILSLLAAIAIPTYQALMDRTKEKTAIATAESVARNAIGLAAFDREGVVVDTPAAAVVGTHIADAAAEVEGDNIAVGTAVASTTRDVCVPLTNIGQDDEDVALHFDAGMNAAFTAVAGSC